MVAAAPPDVSPCLPPSRRAQTRRLDCHTGPGRRYWVMEHRSSGPGPASLRGATGPAARHSIARVRNGSDRPGGSTPHWPARWITDERSPRKRCWRGLREAWAGIEPAYRAFAELCLTTWLPGRKRWAALLTKIQAPGKRLSRCSARVWIRFGPRGEAAVRGQRPGPGGQAVGGALSTAHRPSSGSSTFFLTVMPPLDFSIFVSPLSLVFLVTCFFLLSAILASRSFCSSSRR